MTYTYNTTICFMPGRRFALTDKNTEHDAFDGETRVRSTRATGFWTNSVTHLVLTGEARRSTVEYKHCADENSSGAEFAPENYRASFSHGELATWSLSR